MSTRGLCALSLALALAVAPAAAPAQPATSFELWVEVGANGAPGELWLEMLRKRLPPPEVTAAAALRRPISADERAWIDAIRSRLRYWPERLPELAAPFEPVTPPAEVRIVLGNRGGDDAFTHNPTTIGFDLSRLVDEYGNASTAENLGRIDRLFEHEYTHLLHKAWAPAHPQPGETPFELALVEMWTEGLGNYRSMSERWRATAGSYSRPARRALDDLAPVLVERLTALACATPEQARPLTADLARGPLDKKWGALPVALWLDAEVSTSPEALRRFVQEGVAGLTALAARRLPPPLAARFEAARAASRACPR